MSEFMRLHERFIEKANRGMTFGALPITPRNADAPLIATDKWRLHDGALLKTFRFRRDDDRDRFITGILEYERHVEHRSTFVVKPETVSVRVTTVDLGRPTELDREYARYCDEMFRDIVSTPTVELEDEL